MVSPKNELEKQVEAAYEYRGHVTLSFKDGKIVVGFMFNRQFADAGFKDEPFVEIFLKGNGDYQKFLIKDLASIALTGEDCAQVTPKHT